jgi:hypothetical protein
MHADAWSAGTTFSYGLEPWTGIFCTLDFMVLVIGLWRFYVLPPEDLPSIQLACESVLQKYWPRFSTLYEKT